MRHTFYVLFCLLQFIYRRGMSSVPASSKYHIMNSRPSVKTHLRPHQREGLEWMINMEDDDNGRGVLADDMGTGKTHTTTTLLHYRPRDTLIVTKSSIISHWRDVIASVNGESPYLLFRNNTCCAPRLLYDQGAKKDGKHEKQHVTAITSYTSIAGHASKPCLEPGCIFRQNWERVVLDEAHVIRNQNTEAFKAVQRLRGGAYRWALTGIPINNTRRDLLSLGKWLDLSLLDPNIADKYILRRTMDSVVEQERRCLAESQRQVTYDGEKKDAAQNAPLLLPSAFDDDDEDSENEDSVLIRDPKKQKTSAEARAPPPPGLETRIVMLKFKYPYEVEIYARLEKAHSARIDLLKEGKSGGGRAAIMEAVLRMRQVCAHPQLYVRGMRQKEASLKANAYGGHVPAASMFSQVIPGKIDADSVASYVNDADKKESDEAIEIVMASKDSRRSTKLDYVINRVREFCSVPDVKVLIFCEWIQEIGILSHVIGRELRDVVPNTVLYTGNLTVMEKARSVHVFEHDPSSRVMLAQIRTGGTGLNLQAASKVIITSPNWNPCNDLQAMCRSYRQGQTRFVTCERLIISGTIDEKCLELQRRKMNDLDDLFEEETFVSRMGW